ncbi:hypothetical protein M409DRAFT_57097 [Zasmidium cellare ATCC 36951]|uniref:F-box domain-containing protein n=1 Tax=Zasmidium cellare ATCC 36951 TaxID=1080233 RepID=A0A6A6CF14_ZASCE|nr:uncharacterized protein M409DRAFT_57097 [Zasmidium cellare ATCC 36951]KAF2163996.1 hypothetical protein M409DRAFT_57097 [Zasmidium cellare ATCC 36951]
MTLFGRSRSKDWENDLSVIRGRRSLYYQQFKGEEEILLDCVAHEREDSKSVQCVVDYLMQRWRNPLTEEEAFSAARAFVEETKNHSAHWATWISSSLLTYSPKKLKPRPPPRPSIWRQDHMQAPTTTQPWSRLLSLPTELLLSILSYTILPSSKTTPFAPPTSTRGLLIGTLSSTHPPIARTCRRLRHETLPLFYSLNTFIFPLTTFSALHTSHLFLAALTDKYVPCLQNILLLGFDRVPLLSHLNHPHPVPHGIAMALAGRYTLRPVRIAVNLRSLSMEIQTEVPRGGEWLCKWEGYLRELKEWLGDVEVGEAEVRTLVSEFGRGVEDLERRGRRVEWFG